MAAKGEKAKVTAEIYALCHPQTGEVRYIGKANDAQKRLKSHIRDSRTRKTPVYSWIRKLQSSGLAPSIRVLEVADDWIEAEKRLIALHREGGRLLNLADGGDEPFCSAETRSANGKRMQVHPNTIANRSRNARNLNKQLQEKPFLKELRGLMCVLARSAKFIESNGNLDKAAKMRESMKKVGLLIRKDPELAFGLCVQSPSLAMAMGVEACQA